jgi:hypothetical protein
VTSPFAHLKVLYAYHTSPAYMQATRLSPFQVDCGPFYEDRFEGGRCLSLKTPSGSYDMAAVVARLPAEQKPDLIVIKSDATRSNMPANLGALACPKVLIVGDTQHMQTPLRTMTAYARSEPFTLVVTDHGRRPLHFFAEAGVENAYWLPGFNLTLHPVTPPPQLAPVVTFVGQAGDLHPVRRHLIEAMQATDLPLRTGSAPQPVAAQAYATSQVNFNCSLNGDVNLRVFEVLAHGGLLLTDALRPQAGLEALFDVGDELLTYDGPTQLVSTVRALLADPALCRHIAAAGAARLKREHLPQHRFEQMAALVGGGNLAGPFPASWDRRVGAFAERAAPLLDLRLAAYEFLQGVNRVAIKLETGFLPGLDPVFAADAADLSRLNVHAQHEADLAEVKALYESAGVAGQIALAPALPDGLKGGFIAGGVADLGNGTLAATLDRFGPRFVLIADLPHDHRNRAQVDAAMSRRGYLPIGDAVSAWQKQDGG